MLRSDPRFKNHNYLMTNVLSLVNEKKFLKRYDEALFETLMRDHFKKCEV